MSSQSQPKTVEIGGVTLHLGAPDATEQGWIGQDAVLRQLLACWLVVDKADRPLAPRLIGPPGIGKTTLAMAAASLVIHQLGNLRNSRQLEAQADTEGMKALARADIPLEGMASLFRRLQEEQGERGYDDHASTQPRERAKEPRENGRKQHRARKFD